MKFFAFTALLLVSTQAVKLRDDDDYQTAAQAVGMRDGDLLGEQVENFMEQAKQAVEDGKMTDRKAAFDRVRAQSPTHSINFLEVPAKQKPLLDKDFKLPDMQK